MFTSTSVCSFALPCVHLHLRVQGMCLGVCSAAPPSPRSWVCSPAPPCPRDVFRGVFTCTSMSSGCAQECVHLHLRVLGVCSPPPPYPRCVFMGVFTCTPCPRGVFMRVFTCTTVSRVCVQGCVHLHLRVLGCVHLNLVSTGCVQECVHLHLHIYGIRGRVC